MEAVANNLIINCNTNYTGNHRVFYFFSNNYGRQTIHIIHKDVVYNYYIILTIAITSASAERNIQN